MNPDELEAKHTYYLFHGYRPQPGDIVVDVGAGTGAELVTACRLVGRSGRVIAIEAHPATFARLAETKARNPRLCANAELVQAAVTDRPGKATVTDRPDHGANSTVLAGEPGVEVEAVTIDDIVERHELSRIDLLKVNIEGGERYAVLGLERSLPVVEHLTVCCHDFLVPTEGEVMATKNEVREWMVANGFDVRERPDEAFLFIRDTLYGRRRRPEGGVAG